MNAVDRESLILSHMPLVRLIARHVFWMYGRRYDLDDLTSTGTLGLIDAVDRYKPGSGANLEAYAHHRIRGEMLSFIKHSTVVYAWRGRASCEHLCGHHLDHPNCQYTPPTEDHAIQSERREMVQSVLSALSAKERGLLCLIAAGVSVRQAAPIVGYAGTYALQVRDRAIAKVRQAIFGRE